MRAAVVGADGSLNVERVADPMPGHGQLLLRVSGCGICGSDIKARSAMPGGTVMGHEFCGDVVGIGPGVSGDWHEGMRAAVLPVFSCGRCVWCIAGEVAHCESASLVGLGGSPGAFAEFALASAELSFVVPESIPEAHGALVEPFAVGLHTARVAKIASGDSVLVVGAGPVGLTTTRWAKEMGAKEVVVADPVAARRELSGRFGATAALDPGHEDLGRDYDVVIDCVGKPGLLNTCVAAAAIKGRIVIAGVCAEPDPFVPISALLKELTVAFSVYYLPEEFRRVIRAFTSGSIDPSPLIAGAVPLEEIDVAFRGVAESTSHSKILVDPREAGSVGAGALSVGA
jgi:(R,R)-butanediol dehydrogenase / meso-butanediol dehydrogenase / diacetyl reductase